MKSLSGPKPIVLALLASVTVIADAQDVSNRQPDYRYIAPTAPLAPADQQRMFHLPPGFQIELVAAEPDIRKPMNLNFDAQGRLLVSTSVEYPDAVAEGEAACDAITVLLDSDRDGVYEQVRTFADGLNIPIGVTPIQGGVLAYSIPHVYRLLDDDGDGRADRREIAYGRFGFSDPHGMVNALTWWIDGWVYACHGEANTSSVAGSNGEVLTLQGGNTWRMCPEGSRAERFTHGQANPFGLCFDPLGNAYSADSHSKPATQLLRGAWYPSLGEPHDGLGFGPTMMRHYHGSTGIAGIVYYAANEFPESYRDTLFLGNPVTGRINHDGLEAFGSTYRAIERPDFLSCDDPWFRPVDLQLGPDGALYIADFYNRFIGRYMSESVERLRDRERGRIWRVVYTGDADPPVRRAKPMDQTRASVDELLGLLCDPNLTVRTHATHQLVERIGNPQRLRKLLQGDAHPWQRVHGLWVLHRLEVLDMQLWSNLARDPDRRVRVHALKALAERGDWNGDFAGARDLAIETLTDSDALVRRAAAEALGRHPAPANVRGLLDAWAAAPADDTLLIHAARMSLRNSLQSSSSIEETAAQFRDRPEDLKRLADVSLGIRTQEAAQFVLQHLQTQAVESSQLERLLFHAARYLDDKSLPELYAYAQTFQDEDEGAQTRILRPLYQAAEQRQIRLPANIQQWATRLARELLASPEEGLLYAGVGLVWDLRLTSLNGPITRLAEQPNGQVPLRSFAMDALTAVNSQAALPVLERLLRNAGEPLAIRQKAVLALGKLNNDRSRDILRRQLMTAPTRLAIAIAQQLSISSQGAGLLLDAVEQGAAAARLLQDAVVEQQVRASGLHDADGRLTRLFTNLPTAEDRLNQLIEERRGGYARTQANAKRGAEIFEKNCGACHQIAGEGGSVGPQLDGIGQRGLERILEDTLDPNRTVAVKYRGSLIALTDGRVISGLVLREEDGIVVVADAEGKEMRILADSIAQRRITELSPMPSDVAENLPLADYFDLIGFLLERPATQDAGRSGDQPRTGR